MSIWQSCLHGSVYAPRCRWRFATAVPVGFRFYRENCGSCTLAQLTTVPWHWKWSLKQELKTQLCVLIIFWTLNDQAIKFKIHCMECSIWTKMWILLRPGLGRLCVRMRIRLNWGRELNHLSIYNYWMFSHIWYTFVFIYQVVLTGINRPLHDGRGMMGNQGKNYSEWVSKMRFLDDFSRISQFQTLDFSWSNSKNVF